MFHLSFFFTVLIDEISILLIVPHWFCNGLYTVSDIYPVSKRSSSQYSVSKHSFCAISNLEIKSFLPCAYCASWIFAPILVPERKSWLVKTDSLAFVLQILLIYSVKYFQTQSSPKIQYITKPNVCKVIGDMPRLTRRDINVLSLAFALGDIIFALKLPQAISLGMTEYHCTAISLVDRRI